ncbi:MAG: RsmB/NOP family class I SAM-dependent RNA methyltransferase [Candidatus Heimdallarchaeota archaeon]|nr:RsmB/NOP family class I SAM-dependent RNA methyltransferase [Candidatus Heimdallarchaeota archaeon]MCK5142906.1 RsmB/NOP family class I SAM-dependent RNA methyltransferase [Candidatus Heimdallarchaeota archaeon]
MNTLIPLILTSLEQVDEGRSIRTILRYHIQDNDLTNYDESLIYYHVFEIYRKLNLIDLYIKTSSSSFSLRKISFRMRALLRFATQLLKVEKENINHVIELLKPHYNKINDLELEDILHSINNLQEEVLYENKHDFASKAALRYFTPTWIIRKFIRQWGKDFAEKILSTFLTTIPMYVRVNDLKSNIEEITLGFEEQEIAFTRDNGIPNLLRIEKTPIPIPRTSEFQNGKIVIQQKASALASLVLNPKSNELILDMCASPGSKTSHIAALLDNKSRITAVDINDERIKILRNRMKMLGVQPIDIIQGDAKQFSKMTTDTFDKILLDPPCSSSGTYSSRPENKWKMKQRDLRWYVDLQTDLLKEAANLVKPDGAIVYSTCSLFHDENHNIILSFLQENEDFYLETPLPVIGTLRTTPHGEVQELYPHLHETEGFFIAKIRKRK